jgi:hypothetical protein
VEQFEILKAYYPKYCDEYFDLGYDAGVMDYGEIRYPCSICGENMRFDLSDEGDRKWIMDMLKRGGIANWYHVDCKPAASNQER